jgi:pilus assembly protein CpaF
MANKIILVVGPQEGVGKSTLAANLAFRYAQNRHQPVLLVDTDLRCRSELTQISGSTLAPSVLEILDQLANQKVALPMLRGRVPLSRHNIGCIPLSFNTRDAEHLTPEQFRFFLESFSQLYDLIVDIEMINPLRTAALDLADAVVWTMLPNALSTRSTIQQLEILHGQKHGFHKFLFALNQVGLPNSLPVQAVLPAMEKFRKTIDTQLPYDTELIRLLNQGQPALIEQSRSGYVVGLLKLIEKLPQFQRDASSSTKTILPAQPGGNGSAPSALSKSAPAQTNVVDSLQEEKRKRRDGFKQRIHRELVEELNIRRIDLDTKGDPARERQLRTNVESTVNALITKEKEMSLAREERERLVKDLVDEALGLGPLEELLADPAITEIMVNRFDQVYIERRGKITLTDKRFIDNNHVVQVIRRIISPLGRRIDESVPMVDARLKDGSRVNAIIPPLAVQGPSITIRRFPERALNGDDLVRTQSINQPMIDFLKVCVLTKKNMVISGGTGTGKTTILNMLSSFIPNDERIVTVEDTAELRMQQEHVVRLEARPANIEGQGQVSIRDLVKNCLRMRPDRIVVGECRGGEALDMLQAMNTGHDGSLTTIHANNPRDAFTRLETLCLMAGMDLPVWALREQIKSAVHIVVQLARLQDGTRKVVCITEVIGRDDTAILTQDLFRFVQDRIDDEGKVQGHYEAAGNLPKFFQELKSKGIGLDASIFKSPKGTLSGDAA